MYGSYAEKSSVGDFSGLDSSGCGVLPDTRRKNVTAFALFSRMRTRDPWKARLPEDHTAPVLHFAVRCLTHSAKILRGTRFACGIAYAGDRFGVCASRSTTEQEPPDTFFLRSVRSAFPQHIALPNAVLAMRLKSRRFSGYAQGPSERALQCCRERSAFRVLCILQYITRQRQSQAFLFAPSGRSGAADQVRGPGKGGRIWTKNTPQIPVRRVGCLCISRVLQSFHRLSSGFDFLFEM